MEVAQDKKTIKDENFNRFWAVYPKKKGKGAAQKAFDKVKVDVETLIHAVEKQKESEDWKKDKGEYIPLPATWLNQGRWDDELNPVSNGNEEEQNKINYLEGLNITNLAEYTKKQMQRLLGEFHQSNIDVIETAYIVIAKHPNRSGTIECMKCGFDQHVNDGHQLKNKKVRCKKCGAIFTKYLKEIET